MDSINEKLLIINLIILKNSYACLMRANKASSEPTWSPEISGRKDTLFHKRVS